MPFRDDPKRLWEAPIRFLTILILAGGTRQTAATAKRWLDSGSRAWKRKFSMLLENFAEV